MKRVYIDPSQPINAPDPLEGYFKMIEEFENEKKGNLSRLASGAAEAKNISEVDPGLLQSSQPRGSHTYSIRQWYARNCSYCSYILLHDPYLLP